MTSRSTSNKLLSAGLAVAAALTLTACILSDKPTPGLKADITPPLGGDFWLKAGQTAFVESADLLVGLLEVTEDIRCPPNRACPLAGMAGIRVRVARGGRDLGDHVLLLGGPNAAEATAGLGAFNLTFRGLRPYRLAASTGTDEYAARLVASVNDEIASANAEFGFNLLAELVEQEKGENVFISPFSISTALAMTYNGAAGSTATSMAEALRYQKMPLD